MAATTIATRNGKYQLDDRRDPMSLCIAWDIWQAENRRAVGLTRTPFQCRKGIAG